MAGSCSACDRGMDARFFAFMDYDNLEPPLEKPRKQCKMRMPAVDTNPPLRSYPACATLCSGEAGVLAYFSFKISSKFPLLSNRIFAIIYLYLCACLQVLSSRADMPIHEMRTAVLRFFTERGLTAMYGACTIKQASKQASSITAPKST